MADLGIDFQSATMDASGTRLPTPGAFTGKFQKIMEGAKDWKEVAKRLKGETVTYFDFETTGIPDYDGQNITNDPVQLGAVQVKDGKIVKRFNVYINPESKLSDWSANNLKRDVVDENGDRVLDENGRPESTLVTPEWLAQQTSQEQALKDFIEFIGPNALLGGQNVPFDVEILKRMADKFGIDLDIAGTIDSKDLASLLPKYDPEKGIDGPKAPDRKTGEIRATSSLGPVANFLGFEPANWHSADGDAEDSYNLVSKIIDRAGKEGNEDLSLLDFPAMAERYKQRMDEFKAVVSPDSPITEAQQRALERLSQSDNPEVSQKALAGIASASTRGEAAKVLADAHAAEDRGIQAPSNSESDPDFDGVEPSPASEISWKMESDPILKRVTYTGSNGYVIKRQGVFGVKKGKSSGYSYVITDPEGNPVPGGRRTTLANAKEFVAKLSNAGSSVPQINSIESDPDFDDVKPSTPVKLTTNVEESDSDFDDADFDDSVFGVDKPSTVTGTSALDDLVGSLADDYLLVIHGLGLASDAPIAMFNAGKRLLEAAEKLDADPTPENKKEYMDKMQNLLNVRAGFIHYANHRSFLGRDSVEDSKLTGDPRLTAAEVALLNSRIAPLDPRVGDQPLKLTALSDKQKEVRRTLTSMTMARYREYLAGLDSKMKLPAGLPSSWSLYKHVDALDAALNQTWTTEPGEGKQALARFFGLISSISDISTYAKEGYSRMVDTTGEYPSIMTVSKSGQATTAAEMAGIVKGISDFAKKINFSGGKDYSKKYFDMFITTTGEDNPIRVKYGSLFGTPSSRTAAYAHRMLGTTFFINQLRGEQRKYDTGAITQLDSARFDHWSSNIRPGSQDAFTATVTHEFGHALDYTTGDEAEQAMKGKPAPSTYGATNNKEKFAEYMSRYLNDQPVPEWFIDTLRDLGLLKSQQSN